MWFDDAVFRWCERLCLLPQVDEVAVSELDGDPAILVVVSPETPKNRRNVGIPVRIEGIPTIVTTRAVDDAETGV